MSNDRAQADKSHTIRTLLSGVLERRYLDHIPEDEREQLREDLRFIRRTLADQRTPRVAVVGDARTNLGALLEALSDHPVEGDPTIKEYLGRGRWYDYAFGRKHLELLDLRTEGDADPSLKALERQCPDTVLFFWAWDDADPDPQVAHLEQVVCTAQNITGRAPSVVAAVHERDLPSDRTLRDAERTLRDRLRTSDVPDVQFTILRANQTEELSAELVESVPVEARLQLTRLVGSARTKERLARLVVHASAGVAAAIAAMPLPVADFVPITSTQLVMIAAVAYIAGRPFTLKMVGEFAAAMGVNVGAGWALREIARALVQFLPFAGSALSSSIAAGATGALGNGAIAFFIEDDRAGVERAAI